MTNSPTYVRLGKKEDIPIILELFKHNFANTVGEDYFETTFAPGLSLRVQANQVMVAEKTGSVVGATELYRHTQTIFENNYHHAAMGVISLFDPDFDGDLDQTVQRLYNSPHIHNVRKISLPNCAKKVASDADITLGAIAVDEGYQGHGIGKTLLRSQISMAQYLGAKLLWSPVDLSGNSMRMHESAGFESVLSIGEYHPGTNINLCVKVLS